MATSTGRMIITGDEDSTDSILEIKGFWLSS
ncbi:hypothetical protein FOWG_16969 [Fusarium oxysporum f. sp. lycopersici MN25]|nr:hypothetical protein FOWG_16969 [Fusarium oxysporum f. sp. lycopersici MN25]